MSARESESSSEQEYDDWVADGEEIEVRDLFDASVHPSASAAFSSMSSRLGLEIVQILQSSCNDYYEYVRAINFIRKQVSLEDACDAVAILTNLASRKSEWLTDDFLIPLIEGDGLLGFSRGHAKATAPLKCGDDDEESWSDDDIDQQQNIQTDRVDVSNLSQIQLLEEFLQLQKREQLLVARIESQNSQIENMKQFTREALADSLRVQNKLSRKKDINLGADDYDSESSSEDENDQGYFAAYAHYGIHESMLKDKVRTESYRNFILQNRHLFDGKVVMDVGCGTSILSLFAIEAGAKHVIAVDKSNIIQKAKLIAQDNGCQSRITFLNKTVESITDDDMKEVEGKVDIIISEWMGYALLFECMLPSVLNARDRWCQSNAVYPDRAQMRLALVSDSELYSAQLDYWNDVYGYKMLPMRSTVIRDGVVKVLEASSVCSTAALIKTIDITTIKADELDFSSEFKCVINDRVNGALHAFVLYFDIDFMKDCTNPIFFSTGPQVEPTHWMQTIMFIESATDVLEPGDVVTGTITCHKSRAYHRDLLIKISYGFEGKSDRKSQEYILQ